MKFEKIKVATLSRADKKLYVELGKAEARADLAVHTHQDMHQLFWAHIRSVCNLSLGVTHYIKDNDIYKNSLVEEEKNE